MKAQNVSRNNNKLLICYKKVAVWGCLIPSQDTIERPLSLWSPSERTKKEKVDFFGIFFKFFYIWLNKPRIWTKKFNAGVTKLWPPDEIRDWQYSINSRSMNYTWLRIGKTTIPVVEDFLAMNKLLLPLLLLLLSIMLLDNFLVAVILPTLRNRFEVTLKIIWLAEETLN